MAKRARSASNASVNIQGKSSGHLKRARSLTTSNGFAPNKIASSVAAAAVDADPPLSNLLKAVDSGLKNCSKGASIVYWMRMGDLRSELHYLLFRDATEVCAPVSDNRALSLASQQAKNDGIPLVVLFALSPQDYVAHDRSPRRIDFTLRNLALMKVSRTWNTYSLPYSYFYIRPLWQNFTYHSILSATRVENPFRHTLWTLSRGLDAPVFMRT